MRAQHGKKFGVAGESTGEVLQTSLCVVCNGPLPEAGFHGNQIPDMVGASASLNRAIWPCEMETSAG